jgi:hypothetical protein
MTVAAILRRAASRKFPGRATPGGTLTPETPETPDRATASGAWADGSASCASPGTVARIPGRLEVTAGGRTHPGQGGAWCGRASPAWPRGGSRCLRRGVDRGNLDRRTIGTGVEDPRALGILSQQGAGPDQGERHQAGQE